VRWSSEHALADTLANFAGQRVAMLRTLHDVDTAADLRSLRVQQDPREKLLSDTALQKEGSPQRHREH
jgi:hypothetical protein